VENFTEMVINYCLLTVWKTAKEMNMKVFAKIVLKNLNGKQKIRRKEIVTGDETSIFQYNPETKYQKSPMEKSSLSDQRKSECQNQQS
jgi:hypothetical protein